MKWADIKRRVQVGVVFESRTGREYRVTEVRPNGYTIERTDTGSAVRISAAKVEQAAAMLLAGQPIAYQANPANGGISYTVAVTVGALYPLRNVPGYVLNNAAKRYEAKP